MGDSHVIENGNGDDKLPEKRQICRSSYIQQRPPWPSIMIIISFWSDHLKKK